MTDHQLNVPSEAPPPSATGPEGRAAERIRDQRYQARVAAERGFYRDCENVHDLPEIFQYWSGHHVRPKLEEFGFSDPTGMFRRYLEEHVERGRHGAKRFASIGSGNCDLEIQLASHFYDRGHRDFIIDCLDLNPAMLQRGRTVATSHGIADRMNFVQADLNDWTAMHEYDAVVANQALHHVINL